MPDSLISHTQDKVFLFVPAPVFQDTKLSEISKKSLAEYFFFMDIGILLCFLFRGRQPLSDGIFRPVTGVLGPVAVVAEHQITPFRHVKFKIRIQDNPLLLEISLLQGLFRIINIDRSVDEPHCLTGQTYNPLDINFLLVLL